jgi:hypothetical protein
MGKISRHLGLKDKAVGACREGCMGEYIIYTPEGEAEEECGGRGATALPARAHMSTSWEGERLREPSSGRYGLRFGAPDYAIYQAEY